MGLETMRRGLLGLGLAWKKAQKLLAKANPLHRQAYLANMEALRRRIAGTDTLLVYLDEAHIHRDCDLGYGWSERGKRLYVASSSPGLSAKVSFYGLYLITEPVVLIWDYPLIFVWDGAPYHRSKMTYEAATRLGIELVRLPANSPNFMPVEALWRWLRERVAYNHCHTSADELLEHVGKFVAQIHRDLVALVKRLHVIEQLDPEVEKLRFSA